MDVEGAVNFKREFIESVVWRLMKRASSYEALKEMVFISTFDMIKDSFDILQSEHA